MKDAEVFPVEAVVDADRVCGSGIVRQVIELGWRSIVSMSKRQQSHVDNVLSGLESKALSKMHGK